jgi:predicted anti-sigma-YlaC factor YlaD
MNETSPEQESHPCCSDLLSSLGAYIDGDLKNELCAEIEQHMKECPRCRIVVNTMKKTIELYQESAEETRLPGDVRERLFVRLDLEEYIKK